MFSRYSDDVEYFDAHPSYIAWVGFYVFWCLRVYCVCKLICVILWE
jgi:hypothetical protein